MDLGIAGKWALVCGASKGLGFGCAQALVREGVNVVINARNADALQVAASQLIAAGADAASARGQNGTKPVVLTVAADITTPEGRAAVFAVPGGPGRDFDIVVTNAGGPPTGDGTTMWMTRLGQSAGCACIGDDASSRAAVRCRARQERRMFSRDK